MQGTITPCDQCGRQAVYSMHDGREHACEQCGHTRGAQLNGQAYAAFETLGFAVNLARGAAVTDAQLREAFEEILTDPHGEGSYPVGGEHVLTRGYRDREWARALAEVSP